MKNVIAAVSLLEEVPNTSYYSDCLQHEHLIKNLTEIIISQKFEKLSEVTIDLLSF